MAKLDALATPVIAPAEANAGLTRLRAEARQPGEASFFGYETPLRSVAAKVLPGEDFVSREALTLVTPLGLCIASDLWDRMARVGGMNHFKLPDGASDNDRFYGAFAMEPLINEPLKLGATRASLEAKVFGGGQVLPGRDSLNVDERNAASCSTACAPSASRRSARTCSTSTRASCACCRAAARRCSSGWPRRAPPSGSSASGEALRRRWRPLRSTCSEANEKGRGW
jgi:chemotaxis receptor (MCP) glutamine deamidase CheD